MSIYDSITGSPLLDVLTGIAIGAVIVITFVVILELRQ